MILFAGEYLKNPGNFSIQPPSNKIQHRTWSRHSSNHALIYYCDFSSQNIRSISDDEIFITLSGNPVINNTNKSIKNQIESIKSAFFGNNFDDFLSKTNGVFCSACLDKESDELVLVTDYIGLRQIFLYEDTERIIFANALWLLTEIINKSLSFNVESIIEIGALGYPLGNRTKYKEIETLPPGCLLRLMPDNARVITQYIDITSTPPRKDITETEAVNLLYETWKTVVSERLDGQQEVFGFLSGGMDSRLLLHTLKSLGCDVYSANFAPQGTRDLVFGKMASESIGTVHFQYPIDNPANDLAAEAIGAWRKTETGHSKFFEINPTIWSGDGGSVGLGHVYLTDDLISLASEHKYFETAELFCKNNNREIPSKLFKDKLTTPKFLARIASLIENYSHTNSEKSPYYFLILNDQRRHMDYHYESFHKRGFDFALPFFDKRLISLISSLPAQSINNHRLYHKLYTLIGGSLTATAWQTYPGHSPCPIEVENGLKYQWDNNFYTSKRIRKIAQKNAYLCLKNILNSKHELHYFNNGYIAIALILTILGITNHSYIKNYLNHLER